MGVKGGGRLLALLDPVLGERSRPSGLEPLLQGYGILFGNDLVVDPARKLPFFDYSSVYVTDFRSHPMVDGLQGLAVLLPVARSVTTTTAAGASSTILLTTSDEGWGETNVEQLIRAGQAGKDAGDTQAPVSLGDGAIAVLALQVGPITLRWVARHRDFVDRGEAGGEFTDEQVSGPFASWVHRHVVRATGPGRQAIDILRRQSEEFSEYCDVYD